MKNLGFEIAIKSSGRGRLTIKFASPIIGNCSIRIYSILFNSTRDELRTSVGIGAAPAVTNAANESF